MAGAAARADGLRRFAVLVLLGLRGQSAARLARPARRAGAARPGGAPPRPRLSEAHGGLRAREAASPAAAGEGGRGLRAAGRRREPRGPGRVRGAARRVARRLRAVHGAQARERRSSLEHLGQSTRRARSGRARARPPRARAGRARGGVRAVRVLRAVGGGSGRGPRARHPHHGRRADLRRTRQRRRLGASGHLPARPRRPRGVPGRGAARLLQRHRPALGQPALPLGRARAHRLRLVDRPHARQLRARGPRPARPLPRLRGLLGGAGRRR